MYKLDMKDKRILHALDVNSRQPNSEIGKQVGLSKQVVGFRVKRLLKDKVISNFYTIIDISKLGFTVHKNFLRLMNLSRRKEKELLDFLISHPNVVWVASCDGRYDVAFGTWAKDMAFLDGTISELNKKFGSYISERQIATIIRGDYFVRDYLVNNKEATLRESFFGAVPAPANLDETDWKILLNLGKNSRTTAVDVSAEIGCSADAIAQRIKKLETGGVIRHYNFVPNESVFPYLHYKILVGLRNISDEKESSFREFCKIHPNIVYIVKALGPWEYEVDIEVESVEQFREILMEIKSAFSEILKDYSALHMYQVHKYNFCPSIPP